MANTKDKDQQIIDTLKRIAAALETQNKLINDVLYYPMDTNKPPRVLVGINDVVEVVSF